MKNDNIPYRSSKTLTFYADAHEQTGSRFRALQTPQATFPGQPRVRQAAGRAIVRNSRISPARTAGKTAQM